ncbi:hypothetical protein [Synechococcus phage Ssp-JY38]|nr:transcription termination/antitermination protein [Synechococcus phage Yong-L2-223]
MTFTLPKPLIPEQFESDWYLLRVRPNYEDIAKEFIEKRVRGAEVYYPMCRRKRVVGPPRAKRVVETSTNPVILGYAYARFNGDWPDMRIIEDWCPAAPRFILRMSADGKNKVPIYVRDKEVMHVKTLEASGRWDEKEVDQNFFLNQLIGKRVRISTGPFAGHNGKIRALHGDLFRIGVRLLGKTAYLSLSISEIEHDLVY